MLYTEHMDALGILFFFVLGAVVGSFLNVVIVRFGFNERAGARSQCAACNETLEGLELVPIVSFVALGGTCRHCGSRISLRYPLVELATGILYALIYWSWSGATTLPALAAFVALLGFATVMVAVVTYDFRHTLIPIPFLQALYVFAAALQVANAVALQSYAPLLEGIYGMLVVGGFFALLHFATAGRGMGIGDAYVGGAIGLVLGLTRGILAGVFGVWIGAVLGVLALLMMRLFPRMQLSLAGTRVTLSAELPFAPFLAMGALVAYAIPVSLALIP